VIADSTPKAICELNTDWQMRKVPIYNDGSYNGDGQWGDRGKKRLSSAGRRAVGDIIFQSISRIEKKLFTYINIHKIPPR